MKFKNVGWQAKGLGMGKTLHLRVLVCISRVLGLHSKSLLHANGEIDLGSLTLHVPKPTFSLILRWVLIHIVGAALLYENIGLYLESIRFSFEEFDV